VLDEAALLGHEASECGLESRKGAFGHLQEHAVGLGGLFLQRLDGLHPSWDLGGMHHGHGVLLGPAARWDAGPSHERGWMGSSLMHLSFSWLGHGGMGCCMVGRATPVAIAPAGVGMLGLGFLMLG
jgi:hypothetical protein